MRRFRIVVCRGPECGDKRDSRAVHQAFVTAIAEAAASDRCQLDWQSCFGRCSQGPNVLVREVASAPAVAPRFTLADLPVSRGGGPRLATALYNRLGPVNAAEIVASHVVRGVVVRRLIEPLPVSAAAGLAALPVTVHTATEFPAASDAPDPPTDVAPPAMLAPEVVPDVSIP